MKKFKAIIFDMDGTLVPSDPTAVPSAAVVAAIHESHKHVFVGVATGRSKMHALPVMHMLDITNQSVLFGGSQIVDPKTGDIIWEKLISPEQLEEVSTVFEAFKTPDSRTFEGDDEIDQIKDYVDTSKALHGMSLIQLDQDRLDEALNAINSIDGVTGHIMESWHSGYNIDISHAEADKEHGVRQLLKMNNLKPEDVLVAGDSSNDLPLFAVGEFRVAMGNATDELKSLADYIAPSVYDDGAAHIINKFILGRDDD